jgi:fatty acid desaturase
MDDLNSEDKSKIINNKGVSYIEFRKTLTPRYSIIWFDISVCYAILIVITALIALVEKKLPYLFLLTIPVGALLIGYMVQSVHLFLHEAVHYNLASDKDRNDLLANLFLGLFVGLDVKFFRANHSAHHKYLGTVRDTEKSYFDGLTWWLVFESLTGLRVLRVVMHRNGNVKLNHGEEKGNAIIKGNNKIFIVAALFNFFLIVAFFLLGFWQLALAWTIGFGAAFPFFASLRGILEHRREEALASVDYKKIDHGISNRLFGDGIIASTIGAAGFNRHLLHHWDPQIPYTRLKNLEDFIMDTPLAAQLEQTQTTYVKAFFLLMNR